MSSRLRVGAVRDRHAEERQRVAVGDGGVFDPVVELRRGHEQGFEVQAVEAAVGDHDHAGVSREHLLSRGDER